LVVNRGNETRPKENSEGRNLNAVDGYETALKVSQVSASFYFLRAQLLNLLQVNIDDVIKRNSHATETTHNPNNATTYSHVFLRIQPYLTTFTQPTSESAEPQQHLQFLIYLFDPAHKLTHTTVTQVVPSKWLAIWDEYDWVEDLIAEALRIGFEVLGQEYVVARMGWGSKEEHNKEGSTSVDPGEREDKGEGSS